MCEYIFPPIGTFRYSEQAQSDLKEELEAVHKQMEDARDAMRLLEEEKERLASTAEQAEKVGVIRHLKKYKK